MENIKIGRKVNLKQKPWEFTSSTGKHYSGISYEVDDPDFEKEIEGLYVRVFTEGTMGTCDYHSNRMNIHIDNDGIITEIHFG